MESFREGYPRLAAFMNSDEAFLMFRRFGHLHNRLLLQQQDELVELEDRLNQIDSVETNAFNLCSRRADRNIERSQLLEEMRRKLREYGSSSSMPIQT